MIQKIEVEVPEGKKAVFNKDLMKIEFKPIRPESYDEWLHDHPGFHGLDLYNVPLKESELQGFSNFIILRRLYSDWIGSWRNDFTGRTYSIKRFSDGLGIRETTGEHNFLEFPDRLMAEEFLGCFKNYFGSETIELI